jgi:hypothetical protein
MTLSIREFMENRDDYTDEGVGGELGAALDALIGAWDEHKEAACVDEDCTCDRFCLDRDNDDECECDYHHPGCYVHDRMDDRGYANSCCANNTFYVKVGPYVRDVIKAARS